MLSEMSLKNTEDVNETQEEVLLSKIVRSIGDRLEYNSPNYDNIKILIPRKQVESMMNLMKLMRGQFNDLVECDNQLKLLVAQLKSVGLKPRAVCFQKQFDKVKMDLDKAEKKVELCRLGVISPRQVYNEINWDNIEMQLFKLAKAIPKLFAEGLSLCE
jgi:hypothetical protein